MAAVSAILGAKGECQLVVPPEELDDVVDEGGEDEGLVELAEDADVGGGAEIAFVNFSAPSRQIEVHAHCTQNALNELTCGRRG